MQDDERLREERKKAKKNKDKYVGMSSESMGFRQAGAFYFASHADPPIHVDADPPTGINLNAFPPTHVDIR
jgi:hypothetical protein